MLFVCMCVVGLLSCRRPWSNCFHSSQLTIVHCCFPGNVRLYALAVPSSASVQVLLIVFTDVLSDVLAQRCLDRRQQCFIQHRPLIARVLVCVPFDSSPVVKQAWRLLVRFFSKLNPGHVMFVLCATWQGVSRPYNTSSWITVPRCSLPWSSSHQSGRELSHCRADSLHPPPLKLCTNYVRDTLVHAHRKSACWSLPVKLWEQGKHSFASRTQRARFQSVARGSRAEWQRVSSEDRRTPTSSWTARGAQHRNAVCVGVFAQQL